MTDYKKLCASLREEAEAVKAIEWDIPICTQTHILEAAEAIEKIVRERDAAVDSLRKSFGNCFYCKYNDPVTHRCKSTPEQAGKCWEWKGVEDDH